MPTSAGIATVALALSLLAACSDTKPSAPPLSEGAYCKGARQWAVHEIAPRHDDDPAWLQKYWGEYLDFVATGKRTAPAAIHDAWRTYGEMIDAQTAVLTKFGFDNAVAEQQATPADKAVFDEPSPEAQEAFGNILSFEALTCDAGQPPAADVDFSGEQPGTYCTALTADNERVAPVEEAGFPPDQVRAAMTSAEADASVEALRNGAPPVIKDDVLAVTDWQRHQQRDALADNGFDIRAVLLHGSAAERQAVQLTDESIRDQFARTVAYEQQVCGE